MKIIAIMPVRNEDWVLGLSARAALMWCDELLLLVHASTDRTAQIASDLQREFPDRVSVIEDANPEWPEMAHRQRLLESARARGATHIAMVDADEILTGNLLPSIRSYVERLGHFMLHLPGYNLRGDIHRYHSNGIWGNRWFSLIFRDHQRLYWSGDTFHHREPCGMGLGHWEPVEQGKGGILHLWGASERRLVAKHALYKVIEHLRWPAKPVADIDRYYNWAVHASASKGTQFSSVWTYSTVPAGWWEPYGLLMRKLNVAAVPWQEAEVRRLVELHGPERFKGLDLFGVDQLSSAA